MPDPIMYADSDTYVVLEPDQPEQFLTASELLEKLKGMLVAMPERLPRDAQKYTGVDEQARYIMETSCELDIGPEQFIQWYAVRLEK